MSKRKSIERSLSPPPLKRKVESTTTKKAVTSFFTPVSKKDPDRVTWRVVNHSLLIGRYQPVVTNQTTAPPAKRTKVAAFDFDSTLIRTRSGNVFAKDAADWQWWHPSVPGALKQLYADGYIVVILSNQGSIGLKNDPKTLKSDQKSLLNFKAKVGAVFSHLDFQLALYAATARDQYRKPRSGMWDEMLEDFDLDVDNGPDLEASFFVGDAGGRLASTGIKADHSCSDRDLAANASIAYKTPEEFFLREAARPYIRLFEPGVYLKERADGVMDAGRIAIDKKNPTDIILFCGSPGAGKSTFYWKYLRPLGYERINQDILKTRDKCVRVASELLSESKSVVIDNTNADIDTRAVWLNMALKAQVPIRCVYFTAPPKLCEHNDTVRALTGGVFNPEKRSILPHSAFAGFASRFKEPTLKEGFQDIFVVEFQFLGEEGERRVWSRHWI